MSRVSYKVPRWVKKKIENELYAQFSLLIIKYDEDGNYKQALKEKAQELMLKIRPFAR